MLVHTSVDNGKLAYAFIDNLQWPHDANLTINVLEEVLSRWHKESLPEVLYLQMDNCFRENKNRFLFAFCALLVESKIFRKVSR